MKTNISLIGMPGAGKSTVGIILAKNMGYGFIDSDVLIQINQQKTLQEIMDQTGHLNLRAVEEREISRINLERHIISTGGSAVYSEKAMTHLAQISHIVFLDVTIENLRKRIHNFESRGIAKNENQSFEELFDERMKLYRKYAHITIDSNKLNQEELAIKIANSVSLIN
ncbi:MAG: shikimate kinase [Spirochaetales bacterium]|nr:shikimate kinase [Spirochaetales bacterium]